MQQELEPYAYVTFFLYTVGFPVFVGTLLFTNRMTCYLDQVMKAARNNDDELKAAGTYKFRKMWHRLYHYYKPQYFYWILLVLVRKFMIAITALVFRSNTLFMLSMTLLVMIISYALQVKHQPYMSTSEYEKVVENNAAMLDEVVSAKLMQLKVVQQQNNRSKAAKLGKESLIDFTKAIPEISFLHNYNTVESGLLFSAIIVNLSGIMFESGQLTGRYKSGLTFFIILLVVVSVFYFCWVLATELWVAFYPDKPFLNIPCLSMCMRGKANLEEVGRISRQESFIMENDLKGATMEGVYEDSMKLDHLESELNKLWATVAEKDKLIKQQQDEIRTLRKEGGTSKFAAIGANIIAQNRKKKQAFGSSSRDITATKRPSGFANTGPLKQPSSKLDFKGPNVPEDRGSDLGFAAADNPMRAKRPDDDL
jgi:hypothetical protein